MADLQARLQAVVGDAYRIEKELGGGGMSRVFLAQEVRLGRTVVVKVLPPQMAAGVSVDRFEREIQLAAKLQHPHIVPLLTAGSAGDLLYYIMPHIEGESLRARLTHDHELPLGETVRILRDIVDALAYAHAHGIVHRDIKPDNVLLSGKHALVTDFGVAKAVADSTGQAALTSIGVALGTPAYMAPEQAAADPHTDHRADLYAVGALAYEMLAGHPPFTGTSPQAVLRAQVNQRLEPISQQRASVPAALAALVMRCLEKKPADRFQNAEELLAQLEAIATPSGTEAAIQRAHPMRVAALFTAASVVVLTAVYWLMRGLGLPDWVLPIAVALLVAGLPITVVTGLAERRRAIAGSTGHFARAAPTGLQQWLTWRKALVGGAAAFAALGLGTTAYMAMRVLGIGPVGTLVASGVLKQREPLIVADFENRTPDSTLGPTLTEALRIDLSQSPTVKLADPEMVAQGLRRMQRPPGTPVTLAVARELAQREGMKAIVSGDIASVGKSYVLSASLVAATNGQILTAMREAAESEGALLGAIDRLSRKLRERIGESLKSIRATEPLEHVTTASLDAVRRYSEAARAEDAGDFDRAAALYQEATTLDTGFAMAYRKLAWTLGVSGASQDRSVAAATKAFVLRERLPEVERYLAIASYYSTLDYDPSKVVAAYRSVLERDPDHTIALQSLATQLVTLRQFREAESLAVRAAALGNPASVWLIQPQVEQGHFAAAETTLARFSRVAPHTPRVRWARALLASAQGAYPAAEQATRALRDEQPTSLTWSYAALFHLAAVDAVRGKLTRAAREDGTAMALNESRGRLRQYLLNALGIAQLDLRLLNQPAKGLRRIEAALRRHPLATVPPLDRPYVPLSRYYARAGRLDEATRLLSEYERTVPEGIRRGDGERHGAEGDLLLARGRIADAIARYQAWYDENTCSCVYHNGGLFEIATAYEQAHTPDSALTYYERFVTTPSLFRVVGDKLTLAPAYKRLGELYEARGDRANARDYYGRFVDLWKDADPELQPVVRDVRARLARLSGEH